MIRSQDFFLHFRRTMLLGLLACTLAALCVTALLEFWLQPGPRFEPVRYHYAYHHGECVLGDVDFDGYADRLRESRAEFYPASFSVESTTPTEQRPTSQFYLAGLDVLHRPYFVEGVNGANLLYALSRPEGDSLVYLNQCRWRPGEQVEVISQRLFDGERAPLNWRTTPYLHGAFAVSDSLGKQRVILAFNGGFQGWRGFMLLDPDSARILAEFPHGLAPTTLADRYLILENGRRQYLCAGGAARNGNTLGGFDDIHCRLYLFDPDSGFTRSWEFGTAHTSQYA